MERADGLAAQIERRPGEPLMACAAHWQIDAFSCRIRLITVRQLCVLAVLRTTTFIMHASRIIIRTHSHERPRPCPSISALARYSLRLAFARLVSFARDGSCWRLKASEADRAHHRESRNEGLEQVAPSALEVELSRHRQLLEKEKEWSHRLQTEVETLRAKQKSQGLSGSPKTTGPL